MRGGEPRGREAALRAGMRLPAGRPVARPWHAACAALHGASAPPRNPPRHPVPASGSCTPTPTRGRAAPPCGRGGRGSRQRASRRGGARPAGGGAPRGPPSPRSTSRTVRLLHPRAGWVLLRDERIPLRRSPKPSPTSAPSCWPGRARRAAAAALARAGRASPTGLCARRERDALVRRFARRLAISAWPTSAASRTATVIRGEPGTGTPGRARVHALAEPPGAPSTPRARTGAATGAGGAPDFAAGRARAPCGVPDGPSVSRARSSRSSRLDRARPAQPRADPERTLWIALVAELAGGGRCSSRYLALRSPARDRAAPLRNRPASPSASPRPCSARSPRRGTPARELSPEAARGVRAATWPAFRELEATLRRAVARRRRGPLGPELLALEDGPAGVPPGRRARRAALAPARAGAGAPGRACTPSSPLARPARPPADRALLQALPTATRSAREPQDLRDAPPRALRRRGLSRAFTRRPSSTSRASAPPRPARALRGALARRGGPVNVAALLEALSTRRSEIRRRGCWCSPSSAPTHPGTRLRGGARFAFEALFDAMFAQISAAGPLRRVPTAGARRRPRRRRCGPSALPRRPSRTARARSCPSPRSSWRWPRRRPSRRPAASPRTARERRQVDRLDLAATRSKALRTSLCLRGEGKKASPSRAYRWSTTNPVRESIRMILRGDHEVATADSVDAALQSLAARRSIWCSSTW